MAVDGTRQTVSMLLCWRKTWWDGVREDMKRFGLPRRRKVKGKMAYFRLSWKVAVKTSCM